VTTANQIIGQALGLLGVRSAADPVTGAEAAICLERLNTMLDAWKVQPLFSYATTKITGTLPSGVSSRTVGPTGADMTATRPVRLEAGCTYTDSSGIERVIERITQAAYEGIQDKEFASDGPEAVFYNPTLPNGVLYFWPRASASVSLSLVVQVQAAAFADLTTDYGLAPGYARAFAYSLAEEVAPDFEREVPASVSRTAFNARRLVQRGNHDVPQLHFDHYRHADRRYGHDILAG
jgi:hypothetical protein